jgi:hypothetical protein
MTGAVALRTVIITIRNYFVSILHRNGLCLRAVLFEPVVRYRRTVVRVLFLGPNRAIGEHKLGDHDLPARIRAVREQNVVTVAVPAIVLLLAYSKLGELEARLRKLRLEQMVIVDHEEPPADDFLLCVVDDVRVPLTHVCCAEVLDLHWTLTKRHTGHDKGRAQHRC